VAIGRAYLVDRTRVKVVYQYLIDEGQLEPEKERFKEAVAKADVQLHQIIEEIPEEIKDHAGILDTHRLILQDRMIYDQTLENISRSISMPSGAEKAVEKAQEIFSKIKDEYIRNRSRMWSDVSGAILRNLTGTELEKLSDIHGQVIVVAHDLSPPDTTQMRLDMYWFCHRYGRKDLPYRHYRPILGNSGVVGLEHSNPGGQQRRPDYRGWYDGQVVLIPIRKP